MQRGPGVLLRSVGAATARIARRPAATAFGSAGHWHTSPGRPFSARRDLVDDLHHHDQGMPSSPLVVPFTGLRPTECPGFDAATGTLGSLGLPHLTTPSAEFRSSLEAYFENGWTLTEVLFSSLTRDGFYEPAAHGLRHPLVFYYAHPAALAINKLRVAGLLDAPVHPRFERLFETGVDEMRWDDVVDTTRSPTWPDLAEVVAYRAAARDAVLTVLRTHPALDAEVDAADVSKDEARWCLAMICEHERIHLETSSVLVRELDLSFIRGRPTEWPVDHPSVRSGVSEEGEMASPLAFSSVDQGTVRLGKPASVPTFGWDNEYGERTIHVDSFEASPFATNGQYLEFVKDAGYARPELWTEDGWSWRSFRNAKWPHFWVPRGPAGLHEYTLRLPFEQLEYLPRDLPAEVNAHEARAFAKWLQSRDTDRKYEYRLMTEAETRLEQQRQHCHSVGSSDFEAHDDPALKSSQELKTLGASRLNVNLAFGSPSAVVPDDRPLGGNVWQWCEDDFAALPGFKTHRLYDDFSTPCFDGQHTVILGGSFASTGDEASSYSRFHFRPHFHQHAGVRVARQPVKQRLPELTSHDAPPPHAQGWRPLTYADACASRSATLRDEEEAQHVPRSSIEEESQDKYETDAQVAAYLDLHYGGEAALDGPAAVMTEMQGSLRSCLHFPRRCADVLNELCASAAKNSDNEGQRKTRALDVGCAVGGASLAMADRFDEVVGLDFSKRFVQVAKQVAAGDSVTYERAMTAGDVNRVRVATERRYSNVKFVVGDACSESDLLNTLLVRPDDDDDENKDESSLFDAVLCANLLCRLPRPDAFFDALPRIVRENGVVLFASPYSFMEAYTPDRSQWCRGPDDLVRRLEPRGFDLCDGFPRDLPLLIRDHARKFQLIFSNAVAFRRRTTSDGQ